jgi:hypothetical protein
MAVRRHTDAYASTDGTQPHRRRRQPISTYGSQQAHHSTVGRARRRQHRRHGRPRQQTDEEGTQMEQPAGRRQPQATQQYSRLARRRHGKPTARRTTTMATRADTQSLARRIRQHRQQPSRHANADGTQTRTTGTRDPDGNTGAHGTQTAQLRRRHADGDPTHPNNQHSHAHLRVRATTRRPNMRQRRKVNSIKIHCRSATDSRTQSNLAGVASGQQWARHI